MQGWKNSFWRADAPRLVARSGRRHSYRYPQFHLGRSNPAEDQASASALFYVRGYGQSGKVSKTVN
jgi:hypothetical protein